MAVSASGHIGGASSGPAVRDRIVSSAGVELVNDITSTPDDHFSASPNSCVAGSRRWCVDCSRRCPAVGAGIVSSACVELVSEISSAPNDHFSAGPHCGVIESIRGRVRAASGCPGIINATS